MWEESECAERLLRGEIGVEGKFQACQAGIFQSACALSVALMLQGLKDALAPDEGGFACWPSPALPLSFSLMPLNNGNLVF